MQTDIRNRYGDRYRRIHNKVKHVKNKTTYNTHVYVALNIYWKKYKINKYCAHVQQRVSKWKKSDKVQKI